VEGAFSQTYSPLEIILSDDCSSDRTFEIMEEMAREYQGPHLVKVGDFNTALHYMCTVFNSRSIVHCRRRRHLHARPNRGVSFNVGEGGGQTA
jgi:glycosyltransferase involved in cell wall biosynthesis